MLPFCSWVTFFLAGTCKSDCQFEVTLVHTASLKDKSTNKPSPWASREPQSRKKETKKSRKTETRKEGEEIRRKKPGERKRAAMTNCLTLFSICPVRPLLQPLREPGLRREQGFNSMRLFPLITLDSVHPLAAFSRTSRSKILILPGTSCSKILF